MELKMEDLLGFCAYYTLAKSAARLPYSSNAPEKKEIERTPPKQSKTNRKKVEVVESKRPNRPKM